MKDRKVPPTVERKLGSLFIVRGSISQRRSILEESIREMFAYFGKIVDEESTRAIQSHDCPRSRELHKCTRGEILDKYANSAARKRLELILQPCDEAATMYRVRGVYVCTTEAAEKRENVLAPTCVPGKCAKSCVKEKEPYTLCLFLRSSPI